jgi:hypothetical protein
MKYTLILVCFLVCIKYIAFCKQVPKPGAKILPINNKENDSSLKRIGSIAPLEGYTLEEQPGKSFGAWLQKQELKKDKTVYLYNGTKKGYQNGCFAVLNISVPNKDVQQCADALMRLRAEYFYEQKAYDKISFKTVEGPFMAFTDFIKGKRWKDVNNRLSSYQVQPIDENNKTKLREGFDYYLFLVFSFCNTFSLNKQASTNILPQKINVGDFFIRGGFPGHAIIAVSTAINNKGQRIAMFAQSFMPAQSIHIIKNPKNDGPWFELNENEGLQYAEYSFNNNEAKTW